MKNNFNVLNIKQSKEKLNEVSSQKDKVENRNNSIQIKLNINSEVINNNFNTDKKNDQHKSNIRDSVKINKSSQKAIKTIDIESIEYYKDLLNKRNKEIEELQLPLNIANQKLINTNNTYNTNNINNINNNSNTDNVERDIRSQSQNENNYGIIVGTFNAGTNKKLNKYQEKNSLDLNIREPDKSNSSKKHINESSDNFRKNNKVSQSLYEVSQSQI